MLVQREFYQGRPQKLAEAALRLSPSATYFAVEQTGKVIGFASSTIDTLTNGVDAIDYFVADFPVGGRIAAHVEALDRKIVARAVDAIVRHAGGLASAADCIQAAAPTAIRRSCS